MQRSGQTAKTQSSGGAPGSGALSPAPRGEERSALPRGQPAGGRLGRRGSPSARGSERRRLRSARRYATLPRDLAGNFGVFLGEGRASSITHTAPAPAAARGRRDPGPSGRRRGGREGAAERCKLRWRPSHVPGGQSFPEVAGGGKSEGILPATPAAPASAPRSACGSPAPRPRPAPTRTTRRRRCCCTGTWP